MCGLFGVTNFEQSAIERARKALHSVRHRGPDQWHDYADENLYMGHQRLSILDLSEQGKQPMVSSESGVVISVNGEIYNFLELKAELADKYTFESTSDSEVVLHGYIEWGIQALLEKLDGMYAICVYDKRRGVLFLARDRVGIKPLYYGTVNNQISWASELKSIVEWYQGDNVLHYDYTAFYDFLTYSYIPTPKTMYKDVHKLEPAHYLRVDVKENKISKYKYWALSTDQVDDDIEVAKNNVFDLVKKSVDEQMVADVPVGFFLSGGMDSSTVVGLAAQNNADINTFSIGFTNKSHDETHFAKIVANAYETAHFTEILAEDQIHAMFDKIKDWYDEPFGDTSCFPTYVVSNLAKKKSTVVLTGDGGDEVFGGYKWYKSFESLQSRPIPKMEFFKKITTALKQRNSILGKIASRLEARYLLRDLELYTRLMGGMLKDEKLQYKAAWNIDEDYDDYWYFEKFYLRDLDTYTRLQYLDFHTYLHDDILAKVDRVSMANSLECRVPLLAKDLIEYSFSLKKEVRICDGELKGVMKRAFQEILPDVVIQRDKKGFSIPLSSWRGLVGPSQTRQERILASFGITKCD
ncbi:asparagine synthase (glutamine-hydrolyzing) [Luminiphilus sp.]|nr:asparagine synthase (glutamine-hydrolyzing) [Luminiphilus sp.]